MKTKLLFFILFLSILSSCQKEDTSDIPQESIFSMSTSEGDKLFDNEVLWNSYFPNSSDQLSIVISDSSNYHVEIHVIGSDLLNSNFPLTIDENTEAYGEIQYRNPNIPMSPVFGELDSINYVGSTLFNDIFIEIKSFENLYVEGEFNGTISTKTGKEIEIYQGTFQTDIILE